MLSCADGLILTPKIGYSVANGKNDQGRLRSKPGTSFRDHLKIIFSLS